MSTGSDAEKGHSARSRPERDTSMSTGSDAEKDAHLRDHLTDGRWHDSCRYCQRRRIHGGTGVETMTHVIPPSVDQNGTQA